MLREVISAGYSDPGSWSALVELIGAPDVWDKLVYTLTNPVEARLVSRSSEWPGLRTRPIDRLTRLFI